MTAIVFEFSEHQMLNKGLFKKKFGVKGHFCTSSSLVYANKVYEYEQLKLVEYQRNVRTLLENVCQLLSD